ncbi:transcriptional regulator, partial [Shigella sonnei]
KIHNDINIQNHVINSSTDAHTHNAPPAIKVNAGYKESIGGAKNFNNKILKHIKSHLIMLSAFVIGAYSAYWLWNNNQPKPFFKDYKTVAEINGCHFNVTEDTIDG